MSNEATEAAWRAKALRQGKRIKVLEETIRGAAAGFDGCDLDPLAYPALWDAYTLLRRAIDEPPAAPPATTAGRPQEDA